MGRMEGQGGFASVLLFRLVFLLETAVVVLEPVAGVHLDRVPIEIFDAHGILTGWARPQFGRYQPHVAEIHDFRRRMSRIKRNAHRLLKGPSIPVYPTKSS